MDASMAPPTPTPRGELVGILSDGLLDPLSGVVRRGRGFGGDGVLKLKLEPLSFVVAWSGVLVLAFNGFPRGIAQLKQRLNQLACLRKENPGSLWPKCTIGAVREGRRLTVDQLRTLNEICARLSAKFFQGNPEKDKSCSVDLSQLYLSIYACRSHEKLLWSTCVTRDKESHNVVSGASTGGSKAGSDSDSDCSVVDGCERERVEAIVAETFDLEMYWPRASMDGNRDSHYRKPVVGSSLLTWLSGNVGVLKVIGEFRAEVETKLPDLYSFFDTDSLHITVRSICEQNLQ